ncbi:DUF4926 domain-containing protein [Longibacter salinarum]|uniref:DUF4926 domain-containing protein n=1 Tax=Longibacter salinarum TaxID=1850348 RepID=A0A2A8D363_9BACT|nr:DUF4926 domain-containing protein [Longibacter salinarum]PEN15399.1 DUF4926 domain-containing protein [Longibacter salinarum]
MAIEELDTVVLLRDAKEHGLEYGDIGAVVHRYAGEGEGEAYELEFVTGEGETVAVLTLSREEIRPMDRREILHARELAA